MPDDNGYSSLCNQPVKWMRAQIPMQIWIGHMLKPFIIIDTLHFHVLNVLNEIDFFSSHLCTYRLKQKKTRGNLCKRNFHSCICAVYTVHSFIHMRTSHSHVSFAHCVHIINSRNASRRCVLLQRMLPHNALNSYYIHKENHETLSRITPASQPASQCSLKLVLQVIRRLCRSVTHLQRNLFEFSSIANSLIEIYILFVKYFNAIWIAAKMFVNVVFLILPSIFCLASAQFSFDFMQAPITDTVKFNSEYDFIVIGAGSGWFFFVCF